LHYCKTGFLQFLQNFDGNDKEVALHFAKSFRNDRVKVGPLKIKVTEEFIAATTGLENTSEQWFNNKKIERKRWQCFVVDKKIEVD